MKTAAVGHGSRTRCGWTSVVNLPEHEHVDPERNAVQSPDHSECPLGRLPYSGTSK
jgi:hypothetical protein